LLLLQGLFLTGLGPYSFWKWSPTTIIRFGATLGSPSSSIMKLQRGDTFSFYRSLVSLAWQSYIPDDDQY
jgi:hypothetical protein